MKLQEPFLVAAIAVSTLVGCATTGKTSTAKAVAIRQTADAVMHISGLSCPF